MSAVAPAPALLRLSGRPAVADARATRRLRRRGRRVAGPDIPPLSPRLHAVRTGLVVVLLLSAGFLVHIVIVSALQQRSAQQGLFDRFRAELAEGTAPIGPTDLDGRALAIGDPVAFLEIPAIGMRQVVVEGTTGGAVLEGPGHRRDTPLPGQAGVSVIAGRRTAFGGPFARITELEPGASIQVTTGQGEFEFEVIGVRREGDPFPAPPAADVGRLVLATADGRPLLPDGVVRVDAEMTADALPGPARLLTSATLPASEDLLAADTDRLWALALWLQALVIGAVGAVWAWHRWGRAQAWVVFLPALLLVSLYVSNHTAQLLPNLL